MEKLHYNLAEEQITGSRKYLLWIVTCFFFLGGIYVIMLRPVFGNESVNPWLSLAPLGIGFFIGLISLYATIKRKDIYFHIDDEIIEFRYGIFRPKKYSFQWNNVKKLVLPHRERKVKLMFADGTSFIIDLSYIQRKRSILIRKHLFHMAKSKNISVITVISLLHHKHQN